MRWGPEPAKWRKSSRSGGEGGACVEVARVAGGVGVRDSKDVRGGVLVFGAAAWSSFLAAPPVSGRETPAER